jgi:hypothetical protein
MHRTSPVLTIEEGLKIQADHLAEWKEVLKPEVYAKLEKIVLEKNKQPMKNGYEVCRGGSITEIVLNARYYLK